MDTAQRINAAKQRLTALADAAAKAGNEVSQMGPPCWGCHYFERTYSNGKCHNPVNHDVRVRRFDVEVKGTKGIDEMRASDGLCGPEALLFERAPLLRRVPWRALVGALWIAGSLALAWFVLPPFAILGLIGIMGFFLEAESGVWICH